MEMEKQLPRADTRSRSAKGRDKIEMAWRHKSRSEKNLIRAIAVLCFALLCFIIAVIAMNFAFKAKIQDLENEINDLKSDAPNTTLPITTEDYNTTAISDTTITDTTTTPVPETTPASTSLESTETSNLTSDSGPESTATTPPEALFEALRSLLTNFSGLKTSARTMDRTSRRGSILSKSHGTFIIMADIDHEEKSITPDPYVYIDGNVPSLSTDGEFVNNTTRSPDLETPFDDTEEDFEGTTEANDDDVIREGSGDGNV